MLALPLAFPTYIVAYVYVDIFDAFGPVQNVLLALTGWRPGAASWYPNIRSLPGAIFVFSLVLYPYVFLAARAMFQTQSACLFEVARTLGATRFMLARHVALPLARPALAVGLSLALMEALNDIGACEYLGVRTLTLSIFTTWLNRSSLPGAAQIACVMLVAVAALIALERYGRRDKRFHLSVRRAQPPAPIVLSGWAAVAACAVCALPVAARLPVAGDRPRRTRRLRAPLRSRSRARRAQHDPVRRRRDRGGAHARLRRRDGGAHDPPALDRLRR